MKKQKSFTPLNAAKRQFRPRRNYLTGFTLIEILVVVAVVGILATVVTVVALEVKEKARIAASLQFSSTIHNALGVYLVGEWKFDGSNSYDDTSGQENHLINGTLPPTSANDISQLGNALPLNGVDDYIESDVIAREYLESYDELTVSAWVNVVIDATSDHPILIDENDVNFERYAFLVWDTNTGDSVVIACLYVTLPNDYACTEEFSGNSWHHVVGVFDKNSGTIVAYADGEAGTVYTNAGISSITSFDDNSEVIRIGAFFAGNFNGYIDQVRVFSEALTSAQIKKLYAEGAEKHGLLVEK